MSCGRFRIDLKKFRPSGPSQGLIPTPFGFWSQGWLTLSSRASEHVGSLHRLFHAIDLNRVMHCPTTFPASSTAFLCNCRRWTLSSSIQCLGACLGLTPPTQRCRALSRPSRSPRKRRASPRTARRMTPINEKPGFCCFASISCATSTVWSSTFR